MPVRLYIFKSIIRRDAIRKFDESHRAPSRFDVKSAKTKGYVIKAILNSLAGCVIYIIMRSEGIKNLKAFIQYF